jgi:hypothetical protein
MHTKPIILQLQLCKLHTLLSGATCCNPTAIIKGFHIKNVTFQSFTYLHACLQVLSFTQEN